MATTTKRKAKAKTKTTAAKAATKTTAAKKVEAPVESAKTENAKTVPLTFTHDDIAARACEIWHRKGCPVGLDEENWRQAEQELTAEALMKR